MKLNILERLTLVGILPPLGSNATLKILRKLRETLSLSEEELREVGTEWEYKCNHFAIGSGWMSERCKNAGYFQEVPKCEIHKTLMERTGSLRLVHPDKAVQLEKEIHMGPVATSMVVDILKRLNGNEQLTEQTNILYVKFVKAAEEEE